MCQRVCLCRFSSDLSQSHLLQARYQSQEVSLHQHCAGRAAPACHRGYRRGQASGVGYVQSGSWANGARRPLLQDKYLTLIPDTASMVAIHILCLYIHMHTQNNSWGCGKELRMHPFYLRLRSVYLQFVFFTYGRGAASKKTKSYFRTVGNLKKKEQTDYPL